MSARLFKVSTLAIVCTLFWSAPAWAAKPTPFKGSWEGMTQSAEPTEDPDVIFVVTAGSGNGTKLGKFTFVSPHLSHQSDGFTEGLFEFTAANGDQVLATVEGFFGPTEGGLLLGELEAVIIGGTGRFGFASGQFQLTILFDFATFQSVGVYDGSILK